MYRGVNSALASFLQKQRGFQVKEEQFGPHQEPATQNTGEKVRYQTEQLPIRMAPVFNRTFPEDLQVRDDIVKDRPLSKNSFFQEMQLIGQVPVSYTHLDVYKRQIHGCVNRITKKRILKKLKKIWITS